MISYQRPKGAFIDVDHGAHSYVIFKLFMYGVFVKLSQCDESREEPHELPSGKMDMERQP